MRNLPFDVYINALAARHVPAYRFAGSTEAGWRDRAARLFALAGEVADRLDREWDRRV